MTRVKSTFPGNKRTAAPVLVDRQTGEDLLETSQERARFIAKTPVLLLTLGAGADADLLDGLERVVGGDESPGAMAGRYQRQGSYGHAVMLDLIERATRREVNRGDERSLPLRRLLRRHLHAVGCFLPPVGRRRTRWRGLGWREQAVDTLLDLGAGRCLARGCNESAERCYCEGHAARERTAIGVPQTNPELTQDLHDAAIERVSELLEEVGDQLGVPRP